MGRGERYTFRNEISGTSSELVRERFKKLLTERTGSMSKPKFIAVDIESTGLRFYADRLYGFAIAWGPRLEDSAYFAPGAWEGARAVLLDPTIEKVGHRFRFDLKFLFANGLPVAGRTWCTKVLQHILNENEGNGLKELAARYFGAANSLEAKTELDNMIAGLGLKHVGELCALDLDGQAPPEAAGLIARYCREDAVNTWRLFEVLGQKLKELDARVREVFQTERGPLSYYVNESMPAEEVLREVEQAGFRIDPGQLEAYGVELRAQIEEKEAALRELALPEIQPIEAALHAKAVAKLKQSEAIARRVPGDPRYGLRFNWNSPPQLGRLLYQEFGLPERRAEKGGFATGEEVLTELAKAPNLPPKVPQVLSGIVELRALQKTLGTYVEGFLERAVGGRLYGQYTPWTDTGRLASEDPNMQNIPRGSRVKRAFIPDTEDAVFVYGDYSQVELRIAADLSQDPLMLEWFQLNLDPHRKEAANIFGVSEAEVTDEQRQVGKTVNFLTIYDGGPGRLAETLKGRSVQDCRALLDAWWSNHGPYRAHLNRLLEIVKRTGALVAKNGRLRRLPDIQYGAWIDYRSRRFVGPTEVLYRIEREIAEGSASKRVYEQPKSQQVFTYCSLKFSHAKKQAYNFPVQSVGASITKAALVELRRQGFTIKTTVHDSIVVQVPRAQAEQAAERVRLIMEGSYKLSVPLKVDLKILNSLDEADKLPSVAGAKKQAA